MNDFPLTPAEAIAVALVIDVRVSKMRENSEAGEYWASIADRLRTWGQQQLQTEPEEGEMPSHDRVSGVRDGRMETLKRPRGAVNTPRATDNYEGVAAR